MAGLEPPAWSCCNSGEPHVAAGCRGVPWGATSPLGAGGTMRPCHRGSRGPQRSGVALCSWSVTWKGQASCQSHMDPLPTQVAEWDMATKLAGPVPGRRGEVSPSPAFSIAQQFGMGMGRGTPQGSHHPHFPSQAPLGGQCLCDHGEVVAVPKPHVPTWSRGDAACGSGLVWCS